MIKGKTAELLALGIMMGIVSKHKGEQPSAQKEDGSFDGLGALTGIGSILGEGLKEMADMDDKKGDAPNLVKEFHKMGMGVDLIGYALDIGLAKDLDATNLSQVDEKIGSLLDKLQDLRTKCQALAVKTALNERRAKHILQVGDYFYTAETGDEIQQLTDKDQKDFFYNIGFKHATDEQIEAHLKTLG